MTYAGIDKKRFAQLLEWGTDDDELRRFFTSSRIQLIQKGARVQNLPHGKPARIRMLTHGLPSATDHLLQKWCLENLTMLDPEPVPDLLETLGMYEEAGESPPVDEAKRLARSCLVHLFQNDPTPQLMSFLSPPQAASAVDLHEPNSLSALPVIAAHSEASASKLAAAVVALVEGQDPDEHLSSLPPAIASVLAGLHAVRNGRSDEMKAALEPLDAQPEARALLIEYADRVTFAHGRTNDSPRGLQIMRFSEPTESESLDIYRNEVIAICTRDYPETAVFVQAIAIQSTSGSWVSLADNAYREKLFYSSGDLIAFPTGRDAPKQPKRGEIGIWRFAENKSSSSSHRTNFHIASEKTLVYEVRDVPFASTQYDSVREWIKDQVEAGGLALVKASLFMLRDNLVVGCPSGKDLAKDEGFESGLPCWAALPAFRFEGRVLVPGPLPASETYECEALASSLRKLLTSEKAGVDKPTRSQVRRLQELLASGEARLNAARSKRLRAELGAIEEQEGVLALLLEEVMLDPQIAVRVEALVQARVDGLVAKKDQLRKSVEQLEQQHATAVEQRRQLEKDQRAIAPAVSKAIRTAFEKARGDALGTLGQVAVFKALLDHLGDAAGLPAPVPPLPVDRRVQDAITVRSADGSLGPHVETLHLLGVTPKWARAIEVVGQLAHECGLILILDGLAARIAIESWISAASGNRQVLDCGIGVTDDSVVKAVVENGPDMIAVLDANLSPLDVYARPLIDAVQRRLAGLGRASSEMKVLMSFSAGIAALPIPAAVEAVALRVSLDRFPTFLREEDVEAVLDEMTALEEHAGWFMRLWKPAAIRVLGHLRSMGPADAALALSVLGEGLRQG